jgi:hypothetical protein
VEGVDLDADGSPSVAGIWLTSIALTGFGAGSADGVAERTPSARADRNRSPCGRAVAAAAGVSLLAAATVAVVFVRHSHDSSAEPVRPAVVAGSGVLATTVPVPLSTGGVVARGMESSPVARPASVTGVKGISTGPVTSSVGYAAEVATGNPVPPSIQPTSPLTTIPTDDGPRLPPSCVLPRCDPPATADPVPVAVAAPEPSQPAAERVASCARDGERRPWMEELLCYAM